MSPSEMRKKEDHELMMKILYEKKFMDYNDALNPFDVGSLRFERFKRHYVKEQIKAIARDFILTSICADYGIEIWN